MTSINSVQLNELSPKIITAPTATAFILTAQDSGSIIFLPTNTGAAIISLPDLKAGLYFKFIAAGVGAAAGYAITSTGANMNVNIVNIPGAAIITHTTGRTSLTSGVAANLLAGDYAEFICNGTNWYVNALSSGAAIGWATA